MRLETLVLNASEDGFRVAADLLKQDGLVSFPTETVYGLGANALSEKAVAGIYAAKGRPSFNPLIVHVGDQNDARRYARIDRLAQIAINTFWPGPLTLVLPRRENCELVPAVSAGLDSVAVRMPNHPVALSLLRASGLPLAAPSANPSGGVSPTTTAHVLDGLAGKISAILDDGPCPVGLESTVLSLTDKHLRLLRPGAISHDALQSALGQTVEVPDDENIPSAPGQLISHYAPSARVVLNASVRPEGALWLGFGSATRDADVFLSETSDLSEAAARLFSALRELDNMASPDQIIAVAPVPETGLGVAINDRLRRAAAPR
jgi:L-threonylcarbamoyladenylate synthase